MKYLLAITFLLLSFGAFAQKSDTLTVPLGKYKFLKVGNKVYKLVTTLEEVKPDQSLLRDSSFNLKSTMWFSVPNSGSHILPVGSLAPVNYLDNTINKQ